MENIFDYSITEKEMIHCFGRVLEKDKYLANLTEDRANVALAYLFYHRGKHRKAKKYINRVKDHNRRNSFWRTVTHPSVCKVVGKKENIVARTIRVTIFKLKRFFILQ